VLVCVFEREKREREIQGTKNVARSLSLDMIGRQAKKLSQLVHHKKTYFSSRCGTNFCRKEIRKTERGRDTERERERIVLCILNIALHD
jgi:hypothetical protein